MKLHVCEVFFKFDISNRNHNQDVRQFWEADEHVGFSLHMRFTEYLQPGPLKADSCKTAATL